MTETLKKIPYGVQNWIILFSVISAINFAVGTWKYKDISDRFISPIEYIDVFIQYIRSYFRPFILLIICVILQSTLSFTIEKALINNYISESAGLAYHVINSLLPTNFTLGSSYMIYVDPCTLFLVTVHVVHITALRQISYALVNSRLRKEWRKSLKETEINTKDINNIYPQNIKLKDTLLFWFGSPSGTYKPDVPRVINLNLNGLGVGLMRIIISSYMAYNILYIFVIPGVTESVQNIEKGFLFEAFKSYIRLLIPTHFLWLIGVYYFTLVGISGTWCKVLGCSTNKKKDWWNSTTVSEYWTKWNYYVHEWYRETMFIPLVNCGVSPEHATVAIFAFSGLLHVFFTELTFRIYNGTTLMGMLLQIPQNDISYYLKKNYGPRISNCYVLLQFIIFQPLFTIFFYYSYKNLVKY